ncbi:DUF3558 domain-containing protein [Amycolatopsis sp. CM201R]|nr:DUF3558 domain-containing protein [Amycolatopsis sp. 505]MDS0142637.1 DUF3558 domain-containing protein [Amycolatopsis sp. CM201R]
MFSALLLAAAACSTTNPGIPSASSAAPGTNSSPESHSALPGPGVPKVLHPVDVTHFKRQPCGALTDSQVAELLGSGVSGKPDLQAPAGPTCSWDAADVSQAGIGVIFMNADQLGLTSVYEAKDKQYKFFQPMESLDGFPIVAYGVSDERASRGRCAVALGVSDTQAVDIHVAQSENNIGKKDPCAAAHDIAAQVLGNLRGGN